MGGDSILVPEDPARIAARYAVQLAQSCCHSDCAGYHGTRLLLRALELGAFKGIERQAEYFRAPLLSLDDAHQRLNVLIPGSGDYAMFAVVSRVLRDSPTGANVTVIDRCETPIALTNWYANRYRIPVHTETTDVFDYQPQQAFDALCADAVLGFFRTAERPRLFAAWQRLLRPQGGAAIIATRIRNVAQDEEIRVDAHRRAEWLYAASQAAEELVRTMGIPREEILRHVARFADSRRTYAVRSIDELLLQLTTVGFRIGVVRQHDDGYFVVTACT